MLGISRTQAPSNPKDILRFAIAVLVSVSLVKTEDSLAKKGIAKELKSFWKAGARGEGIPPSCPKRPESQLAAHRAAQKAEC